MASFNLKDVGIVAVPLLLIGALVMDRRQDEHPMPLKPTKPSDDDFARPSRRRRRRVKDDFFNQKVDEDYFRADDDDDEEDEEEGQEYDAFTEDCRVCARPYEINKLGWTLINHFMKESQNGQLGWYHSKRNPDGVRKTARNIAGYELSSYGTGALEHYYDEGNRSKIFGQVIVLLRNSLVSNLLAGDYINFIEMMDIDDVDGEPKFGKDFGEKWESEDFFLETEVVNHEEHDEIDHLIEDLDKLTAFCIQFLHDGVYGGESQGMQDLGDDMKEEIVRYVEGSIELKFVYEEGDLTLIRASYTNDPDGPVIYLPPAAYLKTKPDDPRGGGHEH